MRKEITINYQSAVRKCVTFLSSRTGFTEGYVRRNYLIEKEQAVCDCGEKCGSVTVILENKRGDAVSETIRHCAFCG